MPTSQPHNGLSAEASLGSADGLPPQLERVQQRVGEWVSDHPWTMIGAAAGVGVALGAATRTRAMNDLTRTVAATASGIAVRLAIDSLTRWFERERPLG